MLRFLGDFCMDASGTRQQIGKYEILEQVGSGGFGAVFKGRDPFIKRFVAIKTCHSADTEIRDRFFQEAEIAGRLAHRNITTVYDFGIDDGLPYLVQEYLTGEDLDHKIQRQDFLPYPEKLYYLLQIARGLSHAHHNGVIHRDIKPANVRILEDGTAKILDFGIAKLAQQQTGLTEIGMTLGTAAYLAPEQIQGAKVSHATDVFSFGVLAYELIAGQRPFKGEQISAVLYQILHQLPARLATHRPDVPKPMAQLIERCLDKDPAARYRDGGHLLESLERLQRRGRAQRETRAFDSDTLAAIPALPPPPAPASDERLDEIVLDSAAHQTSGTSFHASTKPRRRALWLLLFLALAATGGLAWWQAPRLQQTAAELGWMASAESPAPSEPPTTTSSGKTEQVPEEPPAVEPASLTAAAESSSVLDTARPNAAPGSPEQPVAMTEPATPSSAPNSADQELTPPPPAEPLPPSSATLILPAPEWTQDMTVRIGKSGRIRPLDRRRTLELEPGTYRLTFAVNSTRYSASEEVVIHLTEGQRKVSPIPIVRPGALSVRARPGRPQGLVSINGAGGRSSPVRRRWLAPDAYLVEIRSRAAESPVVQTKAVTIQSGFETIVTFDLEDGVAPTIRTKPLPP